MPGKKPSGNTEPCLTDYRRNDACYVLALMYKDYRTATRICVRALRRIPTDPGGTWAMRLNGCMHRRHTRSAIRKVA